MNPNPDFVRQMGDACCGVSILLRAVGGAPRKADPPYLPDALLRRLAKELAEQIHATSLVIAIGTGKEQSCGFHPLKGRRKFKIVDLSAEEVALAHHLQIPVMAGETVAGKIDAVIGGKGREFRTPDRNLACMIGRLLSVLLDRDGLLHSTEAFVRREDALVQRSAQDRRCNNMVFGVSQLLQTCAPRETSTFERIVQMLFHAIPAAAACIGVWKAEGGQDVFAAQGLEGATVDLRRVVESELEAVSSASEGFLVRGFMRPEDAGLAGCLSSVVMVSAGSSPERRAVLALGRAKDAASFTTVERQCLQVVAAFLRKS